MLGLPLSRLKIYNAEDFPGYLPKLNQLYDDLFAGGKGFRSHLTSRVAGCIGLADSTTHLLCQTIEFIHNASLLHDDLVDRSTLRRGKPAAWSKYTPEYAVLAGDYLLARVMVNLSSHGNLELIGFTAKVISDLLEGEWIQDSLVRDFDVGLEQLDRVHNLKTGALFRWCLRSPFIAANNSNSALHSELERAGLALGQLFQRSDDLLDFDVRNGEGKAILGDLKSGYINSFASFLLAGLSSADRRRMASSQSLGELKASVGEAVFDRKLAEFDTINQSLLDRYSHHCEQAAKSLEAESARRLLAELAPLGRQLYWRRKDA